MEFDWECAIILLRRISVKLFFFIFFFITKRKLVGKYKGT